MRMLLLSLLVLAAMPIVAQNHMRGGGLIPVTEFRGRYCQSVGPRGWAVVAENPQRVSFGADMMSPDGRAAAGFSIFGTGSIGPGPGFENPDRGIATNLSRMGSLRVRFGQKQRLEQNVFMLFYQTSESEGVAFYQVIPAQRGGWMVTLRTAYVASGTWRQRGAEASAVARALHCNVPSVPAAPEPPSLNHKPTNQPAGDESGESDSGYNVWLDKETFHDPISGQNYWVSPSSDFIQNGPQGPGYYAQHANETIKLQSGYSQ